MCLLARLVCVCVCVCVYPLLLAFVLANVLALTISGSNFALNITVADKAGGVYMLVYR